MSVMVKTKYLVGIAVLILVILAFFVDNYYKPKPIELVAQTYSCDNRTCNYYLKISNRNYNAQRAELIINGYIDKLSGESIKRETLYADRIEFKVLAGEEKNMNGSFSVIRKPDELIFQVSKINKPVL